MFTKLLILFIGLPLLEVIILVKLGAEIGFWPTVFIIVATGVWGASLAREQGLSIWSDIQQELQLGRIPATKLVDGLLILVGGIVLLTPGILTDIFGLVLLIPATRNILKRWLRVKFEEMTQEGRSNITYFLR